jgi:hypothetical protein
MIRKTTTVPILFFYELDENQTKEAIALYKTEEKAAEQSYVQAWGYFMPLENFMRLEASEWHGSAHLTNTSGLVMKISPCGTEATVGLMY